MTEPTKKKRTGAEYHDERGRIKRFEPTDAMRRDVEAAAALGTPHADITLLVEWGRSAPISVKTLTRHFHIELARGKARATVKVARKVFEQATEGHFGSQMFWLKCQAGWKETQVVEATGKDGAPLPAPVVATIYLPMKESAVEEAQGDNVGKSARAAGMRPGADEPVSAAAPLVKRARSAPGDEPSAHGTIEPVNEHISKRYRI